MTYQPNVGSGLIVALTVGACVDDFGPCKGQMLQVQASTIRANLGSVQQGTFHMLHFMLACDRGPHSTHHSQAMH